MSRPRSIYVVSIFHFHLHYDYSYNHMNTDTLALLLTEYVLLFLDDQCE